MSYKITAAYLKRRMQDSGSDNTVDYLVYEFTNIVGENKKKFNNRWIKQTKLLKAVEFEKDKEYKITLSEAPSPNAINLPYPIEISWDKEKVYMKGGNSIIRVGKNKEEENLSVPLNKILGTNNYETAARNKFGKGILTEDLLLEMNSRGIFFFVHYYDPQDKRKSGGCSIGSTTQGKENYVLVQKETQDEIYRDIERIKRNYINGEIEKHFKITTELLHPKKRK